MHGEDRKTKAAWSFISLTSEHPDSDHRNFLGLDEAINNGDLPELYVLHSTLAFRGTECQLVLML